MQWDSLHQAQIFIWSSRLTWQQHFRPCTLGNAPQPPAFCHTPGTPCCLHTQNVRLLRTRWAASEERDQEGKRYNRFSAPPSKLLSSLGLTEKDKAQARAIPSLLSPTRNTSCVQRNHWDPQEVNHQLPLLSIFILLQQCPALFEDTTGKHLYHWWGGFCLQHLGRTTNRQNSHRSIFKLCQLGDLPMTMQHPAYPNTQAN